MAASSALPIPSYLLSLVLPTRNHKYLPLLRWDPPLSHIGCRVRKLPHEFFFYAARRSPPPLPAAARRLGRLEAANRLLLLVQGLVWIPLWFGVFELGSDDGVRIPGVGVRVPVPEIFELWRREEWETIEGKRRILARARRRIEVEVVEQGKAKRVYYDPSPGSVFEGPWAKEERALRRESLRKKGTEIFEYLGEVF